MSCFLYASGESSFGICAFINKAIKDKLFPYDILSVIHSCISLKSFWMAVLQEAAGFAFHSEEPLSLIWRPGHEINCRIASFSGTSDI